MVHIDDTASVDNRSVISDNSSVLGNARLRITALWKNSVAEGSADISGCVLTDSAKISEDAMADACFLFDQSHIGGNARVVEVTFEGDAHVFGNAILVNRSTPELFKIILRQGCKFGGNATFEGLKTPEDFIKKYGKEHVKHEKQTVILTNVCDMG